MRGPRTHLCKHGEVKELVKSGMPYAEAAELFSQRIFNMVRPTPARLVTPQIQQVCMLLRYIFSCVWWCGVLCGCVGVCHVN